MKFIYKDRIGGRDRFISLIILSSVYVVKVKPEANYTSSLDSSQNLPPFPIEGANWRWTALSGPSIKIAQMSFSWTQQNELYGVQILLKGVSSSFNPVIASQYVTVSLPLFKMATVRQNENNYIS